MTPIETILRAFAERGKNLYLGEAVTELEHALQSAHLARMAGANDELVIAALLHDIGHLLHGLPEDVANRGIDARHEDEGSAWLEQHFSRSICDPVRLHVAAKRYLCAVEPGYLLGLSPASRLSLELQGGPFDPEGVRAFEAEPFAQQAASLRRWDDGAKVPGRVVPGLDEYRPMLESAVLRGESR